MKMSLVGGQALPAAADPVVTSISSGRSPWWSVVLGVLQADGSIPVEERVITMDEVWDADEVWISSSSKEVVPVVKLDGKLVGDGKPGPVWEKAAKLYSAGKYDY